MKYCDNCNKSEKEQCLVEFGDEHWCLDCMRQAGICLSCGCEIRMFVDDFFTYEDDQCPTCIKNETVNQQQKQK